jgi:hypothetical protein
MSKKELDDSGSAENNQTGNESGKVVPDKSSLNEENSEVVFYYSREHRLKRAPRRVREFAESQSARPSLLRSIVGNKGNIFLLVSILMVCVMYILGARASRTGGDLSLGGNRISLSFESPSGESFSRGRAAGLSLLIKKTIQAEGSYTGPVDVIVSPVMQKDDEGPPEAFAERIFFTLEAEENFILSLPFGGDAFFVIFQSETERAIRQIKAR